MGDTTTDITVSRADIDRIRAKALEANDAQVELNGLDDESMVAVIELCDVLLGHVTVDAFLRDQDIE